MSETPVETRSAAHAALLPGLGSAQFTAEAGGRKAAPLHELLIVIGQRGLDRSAIEIILRG